MQHVCNVLNFLSDCSNRTVEFCFFDRQQNSRVVQDTGDVNKFIDHGIKARKRQDNENNILELCLMWLYNRSFLSEVL